jgi:hypothetical protein
VYFKLGKTVIVGLFAAACVVSGTVAQEQLFRDMLGTFQRMQPRPTGPGDIPHASSVPASPPQQISSSKPTINCSNIQTPLGLILCSDENAARIDWDVNGAAWAYAFSLDDVARKTFWQHHDAWVKSVFATCRLTPQISMSQRGCVVNAYRARAKALQSKLTGDALAETKLSPEERANIQSRLVSLGLMTGASDGEFGPSTRAAIRKFQQANGFQESAYLTAEQRQVLLASGKLGHAQGQDLPAAPIGQIGTSLDLRQAPHEPNVTGQSQAQRFPTAPTGQVGTGPSRHYSISACSNGVGYRVRRYS